MHISIETLKGKRIKLDVEDSSNTIDLKIHGEPTRELVVDLSPTPDPGAVMMIFLNTLTGGTQTFEVQGTDTIREVKAKYEERNGTPVEQQRLIFEVQISIKTLKGKNINLEVADSSDTIDLKINGEPTRQLVLRLGPAAVMRIFVSTIKEKTFILEVKGSDTIKKLKAMIHDQGGPPVDQQDLNHLGTKLKNNRTVADYNIKPDANLVIMQSGCIC
ncbi:Ubiquitin domain [Arabidopsis suecica]|uniref:Ubiquitin domain n=1 Tax=Arabidopsis suecica TaxID=45249 RepID=A0A8T2CLX1_ARASU|nr:Ubiquitin domain [Arabidopsis suecica]